MLGPRRCDRQEANGLRRCATARPIRKGKLFQGGLVDSGRGSDGEPELAFEPLRRVWRQGYATEASLAVMDWARSSGYERVWATVWEWNTASRRVLAKLGFTETDRTEVDPVRGTTLFTMRRTARTPMSPQSGSTRHRQAVGSPDRGGKTRPGEGVCWGRR